MLDNQAPSLAEALLTALQFPMPSVGKFVGEEVSALLRFLLAMKAMPVPVICIWRRERCAAASLTT